MHVQSAKLSGSKRSSFLQRRRLAAQFSLASAAIAVFATTFVPSDAEACGCVSPPDLGTGGNEVAQSGEHILFEVGQGTITAHVLIEYSGSPETFAWLVPVPNVPVFGITPAALFRLIGTSSAPFVNYVGTTDLCPQPEYYCNYHPSCPSTETNWPGTETVTWTDTATGTDTTTTTTIPGIEIEKEEQVGDYDVVVFKAEEAGNAVKWLKDNGFVVNDSMAPYMQPYLDAKMSFVALKLVPNAGVSSIKPLRMTYVASEPMIPLQLTAVAAEPHMPITTYIAASDAYVPRDHELIELDPAELAFGRNGSNYPSMVSQAIDRVGGSGFVMESAAPLQELSGTVGCCGNEQDFCGVGNDSLCQCPLSAFDASDCADYPDVVEAYTIYERMREQGQTISRLLTRLSPEEMKFDPVFKAEPTLDTNFRLQILGNSNSLAWCEDRITAGDKEEYQALKDSQQCADLYCGSGICTLTQEGVGCGCDGGAVARAYVDFDRTTSVTCIPDDNLVDLSLDSQVPDPCLTASCGAGTCVAVNGFATCACDAGNAGVISATTGKLTCVPATKYTSTAGGQDLSDGYEDIAVCRQPVPQCGADGWLVHNPSVSNIGVICDDWIAPTAQDFEIPAGPNCGDTGSNTNTWTTDTTTTGFPTDSNNTTTTDGTGLTTTSTDTVAGQEEDSGAVDDGCSLAPSRTQGPAALFGLLTLGGAFWRRRRART